MGDRNDSAQFICAEFEAEEVDGLTPKTSGMVSILGMGGGELGLRSWSC